ncbi:FtsQ-type POTRA domain-containing protein [Corynebacterium sp.]|uniref:cell division protein FtsQ/DivIB n=1 Tax=Corynebacterium sp. TaxID=1720 RepID=UPI0019C37576|nr:FtsQ-type POTRA domain-containing protein [Corynebacterium sp.]HHU66707.1 FtsQ-type POTRA domain-containing protein [Corynebacterium sp.]
MSRRSILRIGGALLAVLLLLVAVVWVFPVLRVNNYAVTGNVHSPEEYVIEATGVSQGDNLVRVDAGQAARGVVDLPWVRSATVSRQWPSTLVVDVTERQALLYSSEADGDHLIDEEGRPFIIDVPPESSVEVTGDLREDLEVLADVAAVISSLPEHVRAMVSTIDAPGRYELALRLHDGRTVYWGASESNHDKSLAMQTAIQRPGEHWNVSNPTLLTVR